MISVDIVITCDFPHTNIVSLICVIQTCAFKKINLKQKTLYLIRQTIKIIKIIIRDIILLHVPFES